MSNFPRVTAMSLCLIGAAHAASINTVHAQGAPPPAPPAATSPLTPPEIAPGHDAPGHDTGGRKLRSPKTADNGPSFVQPPPNVGDSGINKGAPPTGTLPVIPPPGTAGGNPQVQPK